MKIAQELFFRGAYWGNFNYCNWIAIGHTEIAVVEVLLQSIAIVFSLPFFVCNNTKLAAMFEVWMNLSNLTLDSKLFKNQDTKTF